jgi:hypothetical protein
LLKRLKPGDKLSNNTSVSLPILSDMNRLIARIQRHLTDDLLSPKWRELRTDDPLSGHCYITAEALWHLIGGKASGYMPHVLTHAAWPEGLDPGETHWFLRKSRRILDPTAGQFDGEIAYDKGRACGFLSREPSRRAKTLMERVKCSGALPA